MKPLILLFDIDGTLLSTGGAGRRALVHAFTQRYEAKNAFDHFDFGGMTDPAIIREGLKGISVEASDAEVAACLRAYLDQLAKEIAATPQYIVHPGMREAVERGLALSRCAVGLGTGNVLEGARIKLARGDLFDQFTFGGFGSDSEDRAELIRVGLERGAERLGVKVNDCRKVIIGDTPKDVSAALANDAECLGVATGRTSVDALLACGSTYAFADLGQPGAMDALFGEA